MLMDFPTIFEFLERFAFLRGEPAAYLSLLVVALILIIADWRVSLLAFTALYLFVGFLFVDVLDPRLAIIKVLMGWFVALILYFTGGQVNWGRLPPDVSPTEVPQLAPTQFLAIGRFRFPTALLKRVLITAVMMVIVVALGQQTEFRLPTLGDSLSHINLAVYILVGAGLVGMGMSVEPLHAGMGIFIFLTGFELFYSVLDQSVMMLAVWSAVNLAVALAVSFLIQARYAIPALLDEPTNSA